MNIEHLQDKQIELLLYELGDVATIEGTDGGRQLANDWFIFHQGDDLIRDVWPWFGARHSRGLNYLSNVFETLSDSRFTYDELTDYFRQFAQKHMAEMLYSLGVVIPGEQPFLEEIVKVCQDTLWVIDSNFQLECKGLPRSAVELLRNVNQGSACSGKVEMMLPDGTKVVADSHQGGTWKSVDIFAVLPDGSTENLVAVDWEQEKGLRCLVFSSNDDEPAYCEPYPLSRREPTNHK